MVFFFPSLEWMGLLYLLARWLMKAVVNSVAELFWYLYQALTSEKTLHHKVLNQYVLTHRRLVTEAAFLGLLLSLKFLYSQQRSKASSRQGL